VRKMALDPKVCPDPDCGAEFVPLTQQRVYCYDPGCKARRVARNNRAKVERVAALKSQGKWQEHLREVCGVGKGTLRHGPRPSVKERACLKCDRRFPVPITSDDHICGACHQENDVLIAEYTDEALGLTPIQPSFPPALS
jgi:hypothetical protein